MRGLRLGVIADLHANLAATQAVYEHLARLELDKTLCLGDITGYNPQASEVLALLRSETKLVVAGNHDRCVDGSGAPGIVSASVAFTHAWTRERLNVEEVGYLLALPNLIVRDEFCAVHGCYLNPDHFYGYVTGSMIEQNLIALASNSSWPRVAFCGHTHQPAVAWLHDGEVYEKPLSGTVTWPEYATAVLINPGSVGQPRDRNPQAAFAVVDFGRREVSAIRVPYDLRKTQAAIERAGFSPDLATRLEKGI